MTEPIAFLRGNCFISVLIISPEDVYNFILIKASKRERERDASCQRNISGHKQSQIVNCQLDLSTKMFASRTRVELSLGDMTNVK